MKGGRGGCYVHIGENLSEGRGGRCRGQAEYFVLVIEASAALSASHRASKCSPPSPTLADN